MGAMFLESVSIGGGTYKLKQQPFHDIPYQCCAGSTIEGYFKWLLYECTKAVYTQRIDRNFVATLEGNGIFRSF